MILGIDPTVDYAFKHLLGREATRPILISVLNSVLRPAPGSEIQTIELLNPFNPKEALDDKLSILDIKARDQAGRQFNVEMQMLAFPFYEKRIIYYACKLHQQQLHQGQDYLELNPTISVSFLNHVLFPNVPEYHLRFSLLEESGRFSFGADLEFHVLELPKFAQSASELETTLEIWLYFLRHAEKIDTEALPTALQEQPLVLRAIEELTMLTQTDQERERYEARRKFQLDHNTAMKLARLEGHEEGRSKGRNEGRNEALIEGVIRNIHLCERLLRRQETPVGQLMSLPPDELTRLADELEAHLLQAQ